MKKLVLIFSTLALIFTTSVGRTAGKSPEETEKVIRSSMLLMVKCDPLGLALARVMNAFVGLSMAHSYGTPGSGYALDGADALAAILKIKNCGDVMVLVAYMEQLGGKHSGVDYSAYYSTPKGKAGIEASAAAYKEELAKFIKAGH